MRGTYPSQQQQLMRNRIAAHRMAGRGQSVADIAAHLHVAERSVFRYLAKPPPAVQESEPAVELADFYMEGACYDRFDIEWAEGSKAQVEAAKRVCDGCPALQKCRTYGLTVGLEDWGVWGGLTRAERKRQAAAAAKPTGTESVA